MKKTGFLMFGLYVNTVQRPDMICLVFLFPHCSYIKPYKPRAELMVQLVVSALCRHKASKKGSRKVVCDDPVKFAAGLRMHKSERAWDATADDFDAHIHELDASPTLNQFFTMYGVLQHEDDVVPGFRVKLKHLTRKDLRRKLSTLNLYVCCISFLGNLRIGTVGIVDTLVLAS